MSKARETIKHIPQGDLKRLIAYCESEPGIESTLILLLIFTGARQCEVVGMTRKCIDLTAGRVFIRAAKGSESRWMALPTRAKQRLFELKAELPGETTVGMLLSWRGLENSQKRHLQRIFDRIMVAALGRKLYTLHSLRHTFALRCYKLFENDILKVKLAMGHGSITSTAQYLKHLQHEEIAKEVSESFNQEDVCVS